MRLPPSGRGAPAPAPAPPAATSGMQRMSSGVRAGPVGPAALAVLMHASIFAGLGASPAAAIPPMAFAQSGQRGPGASGSGWRPPPPPPVQTAVPADPPAPATRQPGRKRRKLRAYTLTQLRNALLRVADNVAAGRSPRWAASAQAEGISGAKTTVCRIGKRMLAVGVAERPEVALTMRRAFVSKLELARMGSPDLRGRKLFSVDELETFAAAIRRYAEMGCGCDVSAVARMMTVALRKMGRTKSSGAPMVATESRAPHR